MKNLDELMYVSRRIGERFDLVQAGGGNTSTKDDDGNMFVKASGVRLSDINSEKHFAKIDNQKLKTLYSNTAWTSLNRKEREQKAESIVQQCNLTQDRRPSIETLLHSLGNGTCLHTHPKLILQAFSGLDNLESFHDTIAFVNYNTPGIDLTLALDSSLQQFHQKNGKDPEGFILLNHGLVVYDTSPKLAWDKTIQILKSISEKLNLKNFDSEIYSNANRISSAMETKFLNPCVTIPAGKIKFLKEAALPPFFPDGVVFIGAGALQTNLENLEDDINNYFIKNTIPPKVFLINQDSYVCGSSFSKAKEIEEVWRLHYDTLVLNTLGIKSLDSNEIFYLSHWEAEKYRQGV